MRQTVSVTIDSNLSEDDLLVAVRIALLEYLEADESVVAVLPTPVVAA